VSPDPGGQSYQTWQDGVHGSAEPQNRGTAEPRNGRTHTSEPVSISRLSNGRHDRPEQCDQRPQNGAKGQDLKDAPHSAPELESIEGPLQYDGIVAEASGAQHDRRGLPIGEHAPDHQGRRGIDRDGGLAPRGVAEMVGDRCGDGEDRSIILRFVRCTYYLGYCQGSCHRR
jgi:hypothetical protein